MVVHIIDMSRRKAAPSPVIHRDYIDELPVYIEKPTLQTAFGDLSTAEIPNKPVSS